MFSAMSSLSILSILSLLLFAAEAARIKRQFAYYQRPLYSPYQPIGLSPIYTQHVAYSHDPYYGAIRPAPVPAAVCNLVPGKDSNVTGVINLMQPASALEPVRIVGTIMNLTPGMHGFHIHQTGDTGEDCKAAGPHFNPANSTHGAPVDTMRHAGDLGNILANDQGVAHVSIIDPLVSLIHGHPHLIIGRAIVVHAGQDDLGKGGDDESLKTGNAGARVACCVIHPPIF